jgi:hypothetical protein
MLAGDSEEAKIDPVNQTAKTATDMEKKRLHLISVIPGTSLGPKLKLTWIPYLLDH